MVERPIKKSERPQVADTDAMPAIEVQVSSFAGDAESDVEGGAEGDAPAPKKASVPQIIKKKDRLDQPDGEGRSEGKDDRGGKGGRGGRDDRGGKGGRDGRDDRGGRGKREEGQRPGGGNLALMRGPKPTQPKPPVAPVISEAASEAADESASDPGMAEVAQEVAVES